jgi:hypothetical protein
VFWVKTVCLLPKWGGARENEQVKKVKSKLRSLQLPPVAYRHVSEDEVAFHSANMDGSYLFVHIFYFILFYIFGYSTTVLLPFPVIRNRDRHPAVIMAVLLALVTMVRRKTKELASGYSYTYNRGYQRLV